MNFTTALSITFYIFLGLRYWGLVLVRKIGLLSYSLRSLWRADIFITILQEEKTVFARSGGSPAKVFFGGWPIASRGSDTSRRRSQERYQARGSFFRLRPRRWAHRTGSALRGALSAPAISLLDSFHGRRFRADSPEKKSPGRSR